MSENLNAHNDASGQEAKIVKASGGARIGAGRKLGSKNKGPNKPGAGRPVGVKDSKPRVRRKGPLLPLSTLNAVIDDKPKPVEPLLVHVLYSVDWNIVRGNKVKLVVIYKVTTKQALELYPNAYNPVKKQLDKWQSLTNIYNDTEHENDRTTVSYQFDDSIPAEEETKFCSLTFRFRFDLDLLATVMFEIQRTRLDLAKIISEYIKETERITSILNHKFKKEL